MTANDNIPEWPASNHTMVQEYLPEYVDLVITGRDPEAVFPMIAKHLAECRDCYGMYLDLLELIEIGESDDLPTTTWTPDLSFLHMPGEVEPADQPQGPLMWRSLAGEILIAFSRSIVDALTLPKRAGALRGQLTHRISQTVPGAPAVDISIEIQTKDALCDIEVVLSREDRSSFQQQGTLVQLRAGGLSQEARSDGMGRVFFEDIPREALPLLRLTVVPG
ncbi:MAG: hypothetical protein OHK0022_22470 [Roseiflexaceae bacterium]